MFQLHCLNPISKVGLEILTTDYKINPNVEEAEGILVRSASMHEMELPESLLAVARAGAGTNNIPLDKCAEKGIVVFNTPGVICLIFQEKSAILLCSTVPLCPVLYVIQMRLPPSLWIWAK